MNRWHDAICGVLTAITIAVLMPIGAAAQDKKPPNSSQLSRTPDGQPDIQGTWQPRAGGEQGATMTAAPKGLTEVPGIKVGHFTITERPTGCTVILTEAGATAVIQPGGSMRDKEVIEAADEKGLAMVFTGMRHFRH